MDKNKYFSKILYLDNDTHAKPPSNTRMGIFLLIILKIFGA